MRFITLALWATVTASALFTGASCTLDDDTRRLRELVDELVGRYTRLDNRASDSDTLVSPILTFTCNYGSGNPPITIPLNKIHPSTFFRAFVGATSREDDGTSVNKVRTAIGECRSFGEAGVMYEVDGEPYTAHDTLFDAKVKDGSEIKVHTEPRIALHFDFLCGGACTHSADFFNIDPTKTFLFLSRAAKEGIEACRTANEPVIYEVNDRVIGLRDRISKYKVKHRTVVTGRMTPLLLRHPSNLPSNPPLPPSNPPLPPSNPPLPPSNPPPPPSNLAPNEPPSRTKKLFYRNE